MKDVTIVTADIAPVTAEKYRRARRLNIILGVVVAFLAIVVVAQMLPGGSPSSPASSKSSPSASEGEGNGGEMEFVRRYADDPMALGDVDAPVVLTLWTDLRCPYCAVFHRDTLPVLLEEYVDSGKVRIEVHDVAFFGEQSEDAAVAARAAGNQGMFAEYVTAIYDVAPEGAHADLPRETLIAFAEQIGIPDMAQFTADLDDPQLRADTQASTLSAQQLGVNSVPFFVAGETALSGAQPVTVFRDFLNAALADAE